MWNLFIEWDRVNKLFCKNLFWNWMDLANQSADMFSSDWLRILIAKIFRTCLILSSSSIYVISAQMVNIKTLHNKNLAESGPQPDINLVLGKKFFQFFSPFFPPGSYLGFLQNFCIGININTFQPVKCSDLANSYPKVSRSKKIILSSEYVFPSFILHPSSWY